MATIEENEPFLPEEERERQRCPNNFEIEDDINIQPQRPSLVVLCGTFLGIFLASADETLVTATYGNISSQFHSLSRGSWLVTGYDFGYCVGLPVYGMLSDLFGRKAPLLWAYGLFGFGCLICGLSTSLSTLIVGRVIAGLGGAGTSTLVSVIIADVMPPSEVAVMRAWMNTVNISGRSFGAPIGSFVANTVGWRWSFLGQIPLVGICILISVFGLSSLLNESSNSDDTDNNNDEKPDGYEGISIWRKIDIAGIISFAATVISFLILIYLAGAEPEIDTQTQTQTHPGLKLLSIGCAFAISLTIFLLVERYWAVKPLIPLNLIRGEFAGFCLVQVLLYSGRFALVPNIVPYFVRVENMNDVLASSFLVAASLGIAVGAMLAGYAIRRTKKYKKMVLLSLLTSITSYLLIFLRWRNPPPSRTTTATILEGLYVFPAGLTKGIIFSAQFICMSASVPKSRLASCVTVYYLCSQVGTVVGTSVGSAMLQGGFAGCLERKLQGLVGKEMVIHNLLNESRYAMGLSEEVQKIVRSCFLYSFQFLPLFSLLSTSVALPLIVFPKERRIS